MNNNFHLFFASSSVVQLNYSNVPRQQYGGVKNNFQFVYCSFTEFVIATNSSAIPPKQNPLGAYF